MASRRKQTSASEAPSETHPGEPREESWGFVKDKDTRLSTLAQWGWYGFVILIVLVFVATVLHKGFYHLGGHSLSHTHKDPVGYAVAQPDECGSEEERVLRVFEWVKSQGAFINPNITTGTFSIKGSEVRGLKVKGSVAQHDVLFQIPPHLLLNVGKLRNHHTLGNLYRKTPELHNAIGGLAVLLLVEAMNVTSFWRPYLCSLPRHVPLPVFYNEKKFERMMNELPAEMRPGFPQLVEARRDVIEMHYVTILAALFEKYPEQFQPSVFTYAKWAWAISIIMSRTWGREIEDPLLAEKGNNKTNVQTLAPAADMPNHVSSSYEAEKGKNDFLLLRAHRNLTSGDQVFISYGKKCKSEFLAHYGFIPTEDEEVPCKKNASHPSAAANRTRMVKWRNMWRRGFATFHDNLQKPNYLQYLASSSARGVQKIARQVVM